MKVDIYGYSVHCPGTPYSPDAKPCALAPFAFGRTVQFPPDFHVSLGECRVHDLGLGKRFRDYRVCTYLGRYCGLQFRVNVPTKKHVPLPVFRVGRRDFPVVWAKPHM